MEWTDPDDEIRSPAELQAQFNRRQDRAEFIHTVNRQAKGQPLSVAQQTARDAPGKKSAPLGKDRVAVQNNDRADRARLNRNDKTDRARLTTRKGGDGSTKVDFRAGDQRL